MRKQRVEPSGGLCYTFAEKTRGDLEENVMITNHSSTSEGAILGRVLESARPTLSRTAAKAFLKFGFLSADQDRMAELAAKARADTLTADEQVEINNYERVGHILAILKLTARRTLETGSNTKRKAKSH